MELDVHDDMSSLFTFDVDDFHPPPQLSPSPDQLPTIQEETPPTKTSNKQYNQQHQYQQPQQYQNFQLILCPDGQITGRFIQDTKSQLHSNSNSQLASTIQSQFHSHSKSNLQTHLQTHSHTHSQADLDPHFNQNHKMI